MLITGEYLEEALFKIALRNINVQLTMQPDSESLGPRVPMDALAKVNLTSAQIDAIRGHNLLIVAPRLRGKTTLIGNILSTVYPNEIVQYFNHSSTDFARRGDAKILVFDECIRGVNFNELVSSRFVNKIIIIADTSFEKVPPQIRGNIDVCLFGGIKNLPYSSLQRIHQSCFGAIKDYRSFVELLDQLTDWKFLLVDKNSGYFILF